jgi:hypothetical protein
MKFSSTKRTILRALFGAIMILGATDNSQAQYCGGTCTLNCIANCGLGSYCTYCNSTYYRCSNCIL